MTSINKSRVLVVDDDAGLLQLLTIRLKSAGYETMSAASGPQALSMMTVLRPHLVISDLRMAGMDGMALFKAIRERDPTLPVIMLTAHGSIPEAVEATQRGVFSFLTKPFDGKVLLEHVARAVQLNGTENSAPRDNSDTWCNEILTRSSSMQELLNEARLVAATDASVFIHGASGTGKELLARALHRASTRHAGPFVAINCAAMPESLLESELFGYMRGAFTGAVRNQKGLFEAAHGGTLFLDEIGDMPLSFQVKLLRAVQERCVRPVGATVSTPVDVRLISASHRDLESMVKTGAFRDDLYYRLNVVTLELPALSQRREDIPLLAMKFLQQVAQHNKKRVEGFATDAMEQLVAAPWPGNVRQLYNVIEQVVALSTTPLVPWRLVQKALRDHSGEIPSLLEARHHFERHYLTQLLQITQGNVSQAARLARRNRTEFYKLLSRHSLDPRMFKESEPVPAPAPAKG